MPRRSSPLSSLSCIVRLTEEAASIAISQAIALAAAQDAHLLMTIIAAKASIPFSPIGAGYVAPIITELNDKATKAGESQAEAAREALRKAGVNGTVRLIVDHVDRVAEEAVRLARASDIIVLDQPRAALDTKGLILEEALFHSGRPILVVSPKKPVAPHPKRMSWAGMARPMPRAL